MRSAQPPNSPPLRNRPGVSRFHGLGVRLNTAVSDHTLTLNLPSFPSGSPAHILTKSPMTKRRTKSARRPQGQIFLGSKLLGELRILMRLASAASSRENDLLDAKPARSF
jgi:hypothetical protein